jgi:hypothetical protein
MRISNLLLGRQNSLRVVLNTSSSVVSARLIDLFALGWLPKLVRPFVDLLEDNLLHKYSVTTPPECVSPDYTTQRGSADCTGGRLSVNSGSASFFNRSLICFLVAFFMLM